MTEKRKLAYRDRYVKYLTQTLSDRFDLVPQFPTLPFVDMTSRIPLVYRVNQREYTQILSAIMTGGDLAFPDIAHELELIWSIPDTYEPEEDFCLDYETSDTNIITFAPQDPHTEPLLVPPGYLLPPFWVVGNLVPGFLPDWFAELITDIIEQFTGYEDDDVLCTIGSLPIGINFDEIIAVIEGGLPRFTVVVEGAGQLELHLLSVPLGGRLLVSVDVEFDIGDIVSGVLNDGFNLIELERDYSSTPPEFDVTHIEEITLIGSGTHTIYCTFIPVLDLDAFPLKFGGGIRKIVWCPDAIPDPEPCDDCLPADAIEIVLNDETFFTETYIPQTFGDLYTETIAHNEELNTLYDDTPQSIGADIPGSAPNVIQKNALCYAIHSFVKLYASSKLCIIQSKNFLEIAWNELQNAINAVYNALENSMAFIYTPNLFSCFVDDAEAISVLQDASAIEELACFLYDELKVVTISQSNFDDALSAAAMSLSGNAGKLACIMQNDSNLTVYLNFLEAYQIALVRQIAGEELECPCEDATTYWLLDMNFATGNQYGTTSMLWNGSGNDGFWNGDGYIVNKAPTVSTLNVAFGLADFGDDYAVVACVTKQHRVGSDGSGSNDTASYAGYSGAGVTGTLQQTFNSSGNTVDGTDVMLGNWNSAITAKARSFNHRNRVQQGTKVTPCELKVHQLVLWGKPSTSGGKPPGAVWAGNTFPTVLADFFP